MWQWLESTEQWCDQRWCCPEYYELSRPVSSKASTTVESLHLLLSPPLHKMLCNTAVRADFVWLKKKFYTDRITWWKDVCHFIPAVLLSMICSNWVELCLNIETISLSINFWQEHLFRVSAYKHQNNKIMLIAELQQPCSSV